MRSKHDLPVLNMGSSSNLFYVSRKQIKSRDKLESLSSPSQKRHNAGSPVTEIWYLLGNMTQNAHAF